MTITIVCDVLGEENNGTTVAATNLIHALKSYGHDVRVLCGNESRAGQPGYYVTKTIRLIPVLQQYVDKVGVELSARDEEIMETAMKGADVVHIMTPFILGTGALKMAKRRGIPVTAGFHCQAENITSHIHLMNSPAANALTYRVMNRIFYRHVDCIHYPTQFIRDIFEEKAGATNGVVISNGVSPVFVHKKAERPERYSGKFLILNSGRYGAEKSQHILLEAVALSRHEKEIQVILAGQGPLYKKYYQLGQKLTNPPVMQLFDRKELVDVINYCDLYVHAAEVDLEAISCLEALSCGLVPVIANSPKCATKNFALSERNLFAVNDPADLAKKIDYWIENPDEKTKAREEYLEYAKQFHLEDCMKKMEDMILATARREYIDENDYSYAVLK